MLAALQPSSNPGKGPEAPDIPGDTNLEALFDEHNSMVFRTAYRIVGQATDAEDVLQTVFLRLLRREDDIDLGSGAKSYLRRAAVNASLDLLRARKRSRTVDVEEVGHQLTQPENTGPDSQSRGRELVRWLRRAVARLSPRAAEIFTLRYLEGYGNKEIAEMLGTSQTSVAVILHRTRNRLGKELQPLVGGMPS